MTLSSRSVPTGPGSRGGRWHEPEYRKAYHRAWRAAHPEYQDRERLRMARRRNPEATVPATYPRPLPQAAVRCPCPCGCGAPVTACGFCSRGLHEEER